MLELRPVLRLEEATSSVSSTLLLMVYAAARAVAQWRVLPEEHKSTLSREMALTGAADTYSISAQSGGPAFLVYYSPAFLRACLQERPNAALPILSEAHAAPAARSHLHCADLRPSCSLCLC
eukprot:4640778-Pleurochrysis_carterae.AAC.1